MVRFGCWRRFAAGRRQGLAAAVRRHAGEAALIQRCQLHKRRNVIDHLPEEHKPSVKKKLRNAYAMTECADAKRALERLHRELMELNPSAARSPGGRRRRSAHGASSTGSGPVASHAREHERDRVGLLHRKDGLPQRKTMAGRDHIERWVGSGLLGGRAPVPQGAGLPGDSVAVNFACEHGCDEGGCRRSEGCVAYDGRESLTFNGAGGPTAPGLQFSATDTSMPPV